jgi:hypothetical protein
MISYARLGGLGAPDGDSLEVHEPTGEFQAWRSRAAVVGRFRGRLADADREALVALAARARGAGPPEAALPPDSGREVVRLDGSRVVVAAGERPAGPWGELLDLLRRVLVEDATAAPHAAVALDGAASAGGVRLTHRGTRPIDLDLGGLAVVVEVWGPDQARVDRRELEDLAAGAGRVTAAPGWSLPLDLGAVPAPPPGGRMVVQASLVAYNGRSPAPVSVLAIEDAPA